MTTKHTPGPWAARVAELRQGAYMIVPPGWTAGKAPLAYVAGDRRDVTPEQAEANARLMAEAPKLQARIESLEKALLDMTKDCEAYSDAIGAPDYSGGPEDAGPDPLHYDLWHLAEERRKSKMLLTLVERYASECSSCDRKGTVEYGPNAGKPCPDCADIRAVLAEVNAPRPHAESRWACPKCQSRNVQVAIVAWHHESAGLNLTYVETDGEAEVRYWFCEDCEESDSGEPIDTLAPPAIAEQLTPAELEAIKARGPHEPLVLNRIGSRATRIIYPDEEAMKLAIETTEFPRLTIDMVQAATAHMREHGTNLADVETISLSPVPVLGDEPIDEAFHARECRGGIDEDEQDPQDSCAHDWNHTGTAYGGDDESYRGEGRVICRKCGADGDA
jgi:hypothetical protein